ncbi:hypothetical protein [Microvirga antarctica]|uniref:hypothetical protein n=1 Tax=Microvirga antarctica TaxID=2819233 RepID=UPI001B30F16D|nr:hypothetical protein [Microvirga antarctica]
MPLGAAPSAAPKVRAEALVGRWGLASYHRDTDRERTLKEARAQCSNAYVIKEGSQGGVIMTMADETEPTEVQVKVSADGRTFIGRPGVAGEISDMEVASFDGTVLTIEYLDPDVTARYGTMVYVRCDAAAGKAAPAKPKQRPAT